MFNDKTIEFQRIKFSYLHYYFKVNAVEVEALPFESFCVRDNYNNVWQNIMCTCI